MPDDPTTTPAAGGDTGTADAGNNPSGGNSGGGGGARPPADLGDAGKRALAAERDARRTTERELRETKDLLASYEEANKSEVEKLADKAAAAEDRASTAELRALRVEVAHEKGLTSAQAKRLVGKTREELEADADELLETFSGKKADGNGKDGDGGGDQPRRTPKENLRPGAAGDDSKAEMSREEAHKLAASIESGGF